jgi:tryptophan-rich sensory protein
MESWRTVAAVAGVVLVAVYAIGSGFWVNSNPGWYYSLNRPSWQPPSWIFGIIWPYNFIMLGVASFVVSRNLSRTLILTWLAFFALSVLAALLWSYLFYSPHNLVGAAIALVTAAILTIPITVITFRVSIGYGLALLPYQIWVAIASSLAVGYALKN